MRGKNKKRVTSAELNCSGDIIYIISNFLYELECNE